MTTRVARQTRKGEPAKVIHSILFKTNIRAQMATAAPPLGPQLGQRGINVTNFCKQFNKETGHIKPGVVLPTRITSRPDRSYDLEICTPTTSWLLKRAAGIRRGSQSPTTDIAGRLSLKHIYEIAKIKSKDKSLQGVELIDICRMTIKTCRSLGIQVQREDLDPDELQRFLDARRETVAEQLKQWADKKAAKALKTV